MACQRLVLWNLRSTLKCFRGSRWLTFLYIQIEIRIYLEKRTIFFVSEIIYCFFFLLSWYNRSRVAKFSARPVIAPFACLDQLVAVRWQIKRKVIELWETIRDFINQSRWSHLMTWCNASHSHFWFCAIFNKIPSPDGYRINKVYFRTRFDFTTQ